jgi:deoxycytidylate deaminase
MRFTRNVSKHSNHRVKVGAVIVKKKPIGVGFNKCKSHPKYTNDTSKSIHAEISALINCKDNNIEGGSIYVYRETKRGVPALARPCKNCMLQLKKRGIKKVFYTVSNKLVWEIEEI